MSTKNVWSTRDVWNAWNGSLELDRLNNQNELHQLNDVNRQNDMERKERSESHQAGPLVAASAVLHDSELCRMIYRTMKLGFSFFNLDSMFIAAVLA